VSGSTGHAIIGQACAAVQGGGHGDGQGLPAAPERGVLVDSGHGGGQAISATLARARVAARTHGGGQGTGVGLEAAGVAARQQTQGDGHPRSGTPGELLGRCRERCRTCAPAL